MLEILNRSGSGGNGLLKGDLEMGYYGTVLAKDFITASSLSSKIGLTAGTLAVTDAQSDWLKFSYHSKPLYVAKRTFRTNLSLADIYKSGAVYGDDTNGLYPMGTPRLQNAKVTIGGKQYRVRLMKVMPSNPYTGTTPGRERLDLFLKLTNGEWLSLTSSDIGSTSWTFGMESASSTRGVVWSGSSTISQLHADTAIYYYWRPVLEPV